MQAVAWRAAAAVAASPWPSPRLCCRSMASVSRFSGRGRNEAVTPVRRHAWLLSPRQARPHASPHHGPHTSPWRGQRNEERAAFAAADTLRPTGRPHAAHRRPQVDKQMPTLDEQHKRVYTLLPLEQQRTRWLLPYREVRSAAPTATAPIGIHRRPPPRLKSTLRRGLEWAISLLVVVGGSAFYWTHVEEIPVVGRRHFVALSEAHEEALGAYLFDMMLQDQNVIHDPTDARVRLVEQVGMRIAAASGKPQWKWQFVVVDSPEVNAQCFPGPAQRQGHRTFNAIAMHTAGGKVVVFTGLLDIIYAREAAYRARVQRLGLRPLGSLQEELEAAATAAEQRPQVGYLTKIFRRNHGHKEHDQQPPSAHANDGSPAPLPAAAWPWEEHPPLRRTVSLEDRLRAWVSGAPQPVPSPPPPPRPAHPPLEPRSEHPHRHVASAVSTAPHSHDVDSAGLRVDRGLLSNHLAVVLGHEVAHALARHSAEQLSRSAPLLLVGLLNQASPLLATVRRHSAAHASQSRIAAGSVFTHGYALPYSRRAESEADRIGLTLMARACFHPGSAASFWGAFSGTTRSMHYFSTHPADAHRAADAVLWYEEAKMEMKRCCR